MGSARTFAAVVAAGLLIASGCSNDDAGSASTTGAANSEDFTFGEPADSADATRVIEIDANDDFSFTPDAVEVEADEIVTFRVSNTGNLEHEFTLGDEAVQQEHEREMEEMGDMAMDDDPNAISIASGETAELTWKFTNADDVLMGCHTAGHYAGGMRGEIMVTDAS